jgi:diguanylate cyclase (GGDEF)-like protein
MPISRVALALMALTGTAAAAAPAVARDWTGYALGVAALSGMALLVFALLLRVRRLVDALASEQALRRQVERALLDSRAELDRMATTDRLTGLLNRRKFEELATIEIGRARRYQHPLALILLDIDDFKSINERFGHELGDMLLGELAQRIRNSIRQSDFAARWGGEEFLILAPRASCGDAIALAEKLRHLIATTRFHAVSQITASVGVATLQPTDALRQMVARADQALARAKVAGPDQLALEGEEREAV